MTTVGSPDPPFWISASLPHRLLRMKLTCMWTAEIMRAYREEALKEMMRFKAAGIPFDWLLDLTAYPPQSRALDGEREDLRKTAVALGLRRMALVVGDNAIVKLQVNRLVATGPLACFRTEAEALAWLHE